MVFKICEGQLFQLISIALFCIHSPLSMVFKIGEGQLFQLISIALFCIHSPLSMVFKIGEGHSFSAYFDCSVLYSFAVINGFQNWRRPSISVYFSTSPFCIHSPLSIVFKIGEGHQYQLIQLLCFVFILRYQIL